jgi:hypothetical protein
MLLNLTDNTIGEWNDIMKLNNVSLQISQFGEIKNSRKPTSTIFNK